MDPAAQSQSQPKADRPLDETPPPVSDPLGISNDLAHITREMYKKNAELAERNRTLSILRKIDAIVLSAVTNISEIARQVSQLLIEEENFKTVSILIYDKDQQILNRISNAEAEVVTLSKKEVLKEIPPILSIPLGRVENIIIRSILDNEFKETNSYFDISLHNITPDQARLIQEKAGIKSFLVYPLVVRRETIGAMSLGLSEERKNLSEYQLDLIARLIGVIGIALDNAILYNEVQSTNERLKALDKLKDEFISIASHELRTPMTAIKSYLWMTINKTTAVDEEKKNFYIQRAYESAGRLISLVNELLNVSRIESGRIILKPSDFSIVQVAQEVTDELQVKAAEKKLTISVDIAEVKNVFADRDKMREVLFNLIGNSVKFTPDGGSITVSFKEEGAMLETSVTDTGKGISKEDFSKLFTKFGRLQNSLSSVAEIEGTGLGLYITKQFLELSGGKIWVESEEGKGSTFTFSLPLFRGQQATTQVSQKPILPENPTPQPALPAS